MSTPHRRLSELFLLAVASGLADPLDEPGLEARLAVLRARYGHIDRIGALLDDACDAYAEARARAEVAADRAYLESLIDGTEDLLSEDTFPRMTPLFTKYVEGSEMFALLEKAATVFGDAVQEVATWTLAGIAIEQARHGPDDDDWGEHED